VLSQLNVLREVAQHRTVYQLNLPTKRSIEACLERKLQKGSVFATITCSRLPWRTRSSSRSYGSECAVQRENATACWIATKTWFSVVVCRLQSHPTAVVVAVLAMTFFFLE
jgi:hypothetical protein